MRIPKLRNNGDGRAFVEIPKSGRKRRYLGKWGSREAERNYEEWLRLYLAGDIKYLGPKSLITLSEVVELYLQYAYSYYHQDGKPPKEYGLIKIAMFHLCDLFGSEPAESLASTHLKAYLNRVSHLPHLNAEGDNIGLSRGYINKLLDRVKRFVKWAEVEGHLPEGKYEHLRIVPGLKRGRTHVRESKRKTPVSWETLQATLPYLNPLIADMTQVQFLCGMRPQDVIGIRWDLVDQSGEVWFYEPEQHKNDHRGQDLIKAIPKLAQGILERYRHREGMESIFCPKESILRQRTQSYGTEHVRNTVGKNIGEKYTNATYGKAVKDGGKRAVKVGVIREYWTPNRLRHGIGTFARSRMSADHARAFLGHRDLDSTEIYAQLDARAMIDVAKMIDRELGLFDAD